MNILQKTARTIIKRSFDFSILVIEFFCNMSTFIQEEVFVF